MGWPWVQNPSSKAYDPQEPFPWVLQVLTANFSILPLGLTVLHLCVSPHIIISPDVKAQSLQSSLSSYNKKEKKKITLHLLFHLFSNTIREFTRRHVVPHCLPTVSSLYSFSPSNTQKPLITWHTAILSTLKILQGLRFYHKSYEYLQKKETKQKPDLPSS